MKKLIYLTLLASIFYACQKDCPGGIQYSYKYYDISENVKQTFPYHFKDTQVWINVNTNDTLHYILKDTISSYDTTMVSPTEGCVENNYSYSGRFSYIFYCLEQNDKNFAFSYLLDKGYAFRLNLKFGNTIYLEYGPKLSDINNFGIVYKNIYVSKYFAENDSLGILRITVNSTKLYRIK